MWLTLFLMTLLVFISRYLFLEPKLPFKLKGKWLHFLDYTGPAVLTAIWVPIVFIKDKQLTLELSNPYLVAACLAVVLALVTRNVLLTTVVSMLCFFFIQS